MTVLEDLKGLVDNLTDELSTNVSESIASDVREDLLADLPLEIVKKRSDETERSPPAEGINRYIKVKS